MNETTLIYITYPKSDKGIFSKTFWINNVIDQVGSIDLNFKVKTISVKNFLLRIVRKNNLGYRVWLPFQDMHQIGGKFKFYEQNRYSIWKSWGKKTILSFYLVFTMGKKHSMLKWSFNNREWMRKYLHDNDLVWWNKHHH